MKPNPASSLVAAACLAPCVASLPALAQSAWLPAPGHFEITPRYVNERFDEFWMGTSTKVELPDHVVQQSAVLTGEYALDASWALDATVGYTWVDTSAFGGAETDEGLTDSHIGVRWRFLDEHRASSSWFPTLTLRAGGIIAGTYDEGLPFSAGDGANGGEFSLLLGKALFDTGFGFYGDAGYRVREAPVPDEFFGSFGVFQSIGSFTLSTGYRHTQSVSGMNIGDPGFTFPELKEVTQLLEFGAGFRDPGDRYYQLFGAVSVDGQNSGDKLIFGVSFTFGF